MKANILLLAISVAVLSSCSTFKSGQTPDDVYYSPAKQISEDDNRKDEKRITENRRNDNYDFEDRSLRMRIANGRRWSAFENSSYWDNYRYDYRCNCNCNFNGFNYGWNQFNNWNTGFYGSYYGWNSGIGFYNPVVVVAPSRPKYIAPRGGSYSSGSYSNGNYSNSNANSGTKSSGGRLIDRVFNGGGNNNNSSSTPRAYEPSRGSGSSGSSSSGSSSSGSGGVSRPARNGN